MTNPPAEEDDLYDLAPPTVPQTAAPKRKAGGAPVSGVVPLAYRTPPGGPSARTDERKLKDQYLPLWLLGGGVAIEVVAAFLRQHTVEGALRSVGIELIGGTILMLAGIMLAARWRAIELGRFWTVVLKLAAISVAPSAVVRIFSPMLNFIPFGGLVGWVGEFVLYFALLGVLFDLDESDTWYCVCVIFLVRLAVYFALLALLSKWA
jgi:hypothetical protein